MQCKFHKKIFEQSVALYKWSGGSSHHHQQRIGGMTTTINTVNRDLVRFTKGDTDFECKPRSGRPQAVKDSAFLDAVKKDPEAATWSLVTGLG